MAIKPKSFKPHTVGRAIKLADYSYDNGWRKLRNRRIKEEPLCRHCLAKDRITPATQVDHIKPRRDGGLDEWDNTQSLCTDCHRVKTADENRRAVKARKDAGA